MKYRVHKIKHNYNQIWHGIKANKNIVVNYNFTDKKEIKNLGLRKEILKSLNKKSSIFVITVAQLDILNRIATSG